MSMCCKSISSHLTRKSECPVRDNRTSLSEPVILFSSYPLPYVYHSSFPSLPLLYSLSLPLSPTSLSPLCLANEKKKKESMGMRLCASRGVEWKSINYLKTRGLQNNIGETQMTSLFNIGKKDERG